jgi:hypothetical protein
MPSFDEKPPLDQKLHEKEAQRAEDLELIEDVKNEAVRLGFFTREFLDSLCVHFLSPEPEDGGGIENQEDPTRDYFMISRPLLERLYRRDATLGENDGLHRSPYVWLSRDINLVKTMSSFEANAVHEFAHPKSYRVFHPEKGEFDGKFFKDMVVNLVQEDEQLQSLQDVDFQKFSFSVYEWSEIYAFLHQREFIRKTAADGEEKIKSWDDRTFMVANNLESEMKVINEEFHVDAQTDMIYEDPHVLSYLLAKTIEQKFPDIQQRVEYLESLGI